MGAVRPDELPMVVPELDELEDELEELLEDDGELGRISFNEKS